MNLKIDLARTDEPETGIFVRAQDKNGKWRSADIAHLDRSSLIQWLRSNGGDNIIAENVVGYLLGHGRLRDAFGEFIA